MHFAKLCWTLGNIKIHLKYSTYDVLFLYITQNICQHLHNLAFLQEFYQKQHLRFYYLFKSYEKLWNLKCLICKVKKI